MDWMKILVQAPYYKKMGLSGMMAIVLTGRELGCGAMASLNGGFWDIQGRIAMSAEMMRSRFRGAGHSLSVLALTNKLCTLKGVRRDTKDTCEMTFTWEDATIAGLATRDNWKKHPKDMLMASCTRKVIRFLAPELLAGTGIDEMETVEVTEVITEKPEPMDDEAVAFIERFNITNSQGTASNFIDYIVLKTGESRRDTIINASKDPEKFAINLDKFVPDVV